MTSSSPSSTAPTSRPTRTSRNSSPTRDSLEAQLSLERIARLGGGVQIAGPYNPTGISQTASRALIFTCDPKAIGEPACAKQITENLARRAFRRPITTEDMNRLMPFYEAGRRDGGSFDQGIEQAVAAVFASPQFLYRGIKGPNTEFALSNLELASRLSFFLWNTGPDEELLTLAAANGLTKPGAMDKQVRRMLADPKASSLVTSFAMKWLNLTDLDQVIPDPALFPGFTDPLRQDFAREAEAFIGSIFSDDRSVVDLLTADHTFVNERLAAHYGIPGVIGTQFRRIAQVPKERAGLLGKAAVLLRTSYGDRTSPVLRGAWVLDKLLGTPPTPPPPDTATDLSQKAGEQPKTVRARLELHREKATCKMCHGVIDPTGLALENFDATGQWRTQDAQAKVAIDATTVLPTGVPINGVVELRAQLAANPALFAQTVTERLMMYAVNRRLGILRHAAGPRHRAQVRERQLQTVFDRPGHREQRRLPQTGSQIGDRMFVTKKHISRRAAPQSRRRHPGPPAPRRDDPRHAFAQSAPSRNFASASSTSCTARSWATPRTAPRWTSGPPPAPVRISNSAPILAPSNRTRNTSRPSAIWRTQRPQAPVHSVHPATWLSATRPDTGAARAHMSTTLDQVIAKIIGQETRMPSLEVASETIVQSAAGNGGSYATLSFRDADSPQPMEYNPRKVFTQLFGEGDTPEERAAIGKQTGSLLDLILDGTKSLQRDLGNKDKAVLDSYLESVREIERRAAESRSAAISPPSKSPKPP